jgi:hypothetical protein
MRPACGSSEGDGVFEPPSNAQVGVGYDELRTTRKVALT